MNNIQNTVQEETIKSGELAVSPFRPLERLVIPQTLYCLDCKELFDYMSPQSIDLIVTDPPYPYEFIETFSWLSEGACKILKPGGYLFCYSGQSYLPEVMKRLTEKMTYKWTMALLHAQSQIVWPARAIARWKPIIVLQNGKKDEEGTPLLNDVINPSGRDKRFHEWGQNEKDIGKIVDQYCPSDGIVCDPFMCGGTVAIVAERLERKWIGCELDNVRFEAANKRILDARKQCKMKFAV